MRVRVLGVVAVQSVGSESGWRTLRGHAATLLAVLVAAPPTGVSIDRLVEAMWRSGATATARGSIQRYVTELRKYLGASAIATTPSGYRLNLDRDEIDSGRFEAMTTAGLRAVASRRMSEAALILDEALALWARPFADSDGGHDLLHLETRRLEELRVRGEDGLLTALLATGDTGRVIDRAQRLVEEDPLHEGWWAHLMMGCYRAGRQAEALRAYRRLAQRLGEELGIEPSRRLRRLEEQILMHDPDLDIQAGLRSQLPADSTRFIGRQDEIGQLLLALHQSRLLTICGPGGVGKSRIAVELTRRLKDVDLTLFASLREVPSSDQVIRRVTQALGVAAHPGITDLESLTRSLEGRSAVLLLDNCEHLQLEVARMVSSLLASLPELKVLVTSQVPIRAAGETVWRLGPMRVEREHGGELPESVELFVDASWRAQPGLELDGPTLEAAAVICRRVEGLPLAIELAAAWNALMTPNEIAERLETLLATSQGPLAGTPPHHVTLDDLTSWSLSLLPDDVAKAARRVAVFEDGFDLDGADAVLGLTSQEHLQRLVAHSIVYVDRSAGVRYRMLLPIQQALLRVPSPEHEDAQRRHRDYYAGLAIELGPQIWFDQRAVERLTADQSNINAAFDRLLADGDMERGARMARALLFHWMFKGHMAEGRQWYRRLLEETPELSPPRRARLLHGSGVLAAFDADYPLALTFLTRAEEDFLALGDEANLAWTHFWLGRTLVARAIAGFSTPAETFAAVPYLEQALTHFSATGQPVGIVFCSLFVGLNSLLLKGDDAVERLEAAAMAAAQLGAPQPKGMAYAMSAMTAATGSDPQKARDRIGRAMELLRSAGDGLNEAITTTIASCIHASLDGADAARDSMRRAIGLHRRYGSPEWDGVALAGAAGVMALTGNSEPAAEVAGYLDQLLPHWRESVSALGLPALVTAGRLDPGDGSHNRNTILELIDQTLRANP